MERPPRAPSAPAPPNPGRVAAGLVVSAVVFDPGGWAAFGPAKHMAIWLLGMLLALAVIIAGPLQVPRSPALVWIGFFAWSAVVGFWAVDPLSHWLGTPDRRLGWFTWLVFGLAFIAGAQLVDARRAIERGAVVSLLLIGSYVFAEWAGFAPVELATTGTRLGGPFGNPAYLGAAVVLLAPLAASVGATDDGAWRLAGVAGTLAGIAALFASQSRAGLAGALAVALATAPRWWRMARRNPRIAGGILVGAVVLIAVTPLGARTGALLDGENAGARGRIAEWAVALDTVTAHPLGVGFEGYRVVFPQHVGEDYTITYGRAVVTDRAHNVVLDLAVTTGVPGALLAITAMAWVIALGRRLVRDPLWWGVGAALIGYAIHHLFLFPLAELDAVFWLLTGMAAGSASARRTEVNVRAVAVPALAGMIALVVVFGARDVLADRHIASAQDAASLEQATAEADGATSLRSDSFRYWLIAAGAAADLALTDGGDLSGALDRIAMARARSPRDPVVLQAEANLLLDHARSTARGDDADRALDAWRGVVSADPNNPTNQLRLGVAAALAGDDGTAERAWTAAERMAPSSPVPARNLASLYAMQGRLDEAAEATRRADAIEASHASEADTASGEGDP